MAVLDISGLPDDPSAAAVMFYERWLAYAGPPRDGEVAARSADGGGWRPDATSLDDASPHHHPADGPPPRAGEDLVLIFPSADYTHTAWRLAAVQNLARGAAPARVNAVSGGSAQARAAALAYLGAAEGVTGQVLQLDDAGAGPVVERAQ